MYYYFKGQINELHKDYLVIEVDNIGYQVFISRPDEYQIGEYRKLYIYNVVREDEQYLAGFPSLAERQAFVSLIKVKGIGPRTALSALSMTNGEQLFQAIASNNVSYLKKLPGIGAKAASQIILDLKGELSGVDSKANPKQYDEVRLALKQLGFRIKEIDDVLAGINIPNATNEQILKEALKRLGKK